MPLIMTLEGPRLRATDRIRTELYGLAPRSWWRTQAQLSGLFDPIKAHPLLVVGGILAGMIFAAKRKRRR